MAALDFPNAPAVGDKYPQPPVVGQPVYTWDGTKWTTLGGAVGSTGASDALPLMAGTAVSGVSPKWSRGDHVHPSDTGLKGYVDAQDALNVAKAGDTMTGDLAISKATPALILNKSGSGQQNLIWGKQGGVERWVFCFGDTTPESGGNSGSNFQLLNYTDTGGFIGTVLTGVRSTGLLQVAADPTVALGIATKQYVDATAGAAASSAAAFNGMQINGSMDVSQERGQTATAASFTYICDGWKLQFAGTMAINGGIATSTSGAVYSSVPFSSILYSSVGTAQAALGATDYAFIAQILEGRRIARLQWGTAAAQPMTIGFWSAHHRTGVYTGSVRNYATTRSYAFTYTQNVADVGQYNVITVPGDTAGVWPTDNTGGMYLTFALATGSTYTAPSANAWLAGNYQAAPGQVNAVSATTDVFRLTGVVILPGAVALTAAQSPQVMRPYDQELQLCKRYYRKLGGISAQDVTNASYGTASGGAATTMPITPEMRAAPSMAKFGTFFTSNCAVSLFSSPTTLVWQISPLAVGQMWDYGNPGGFIVDARL